MSLLEDDIEADILDRLYLLTKVKTLSIRYSFNNQDEEFWCRYAIPTIYSIWEGFFVTAIHTYIREINKLNLKIDELSDYYLVHNTEVSFKQLFSYPNKYPQKAKFIKDIHSYFISPNPIYIIPQINTESNLGFNVLNKLLEKFNLNTIPEFIRPRHSLKDELNEFLLKVRNGISHGNYPYQIDRAQVDRGIALVEELMFLVYDSIKKGYEDCVFFSS